MNKYQHYTLHVETIDDVEGVWLCLDDGQHSEPLASFLTEEAAEKFKQALNATFTKAHTMGRMGI